MDIIFEIARWLSVATLGVFAGAMLTEGLVLVPYWRSLKPREFFAWYAANGQRLLGFFGPLTSVTACNACGCTFGGGGLHLLPLLSKSECQFYCRKPQR